VSDQKKHKQKKHKQKTTNKRLHKKMGHYQKRPFYHLETQENGMDGTSCPNSSEHLVRICSRWIRPQVCEGNINDDNEEEEEEVNDIEGCHQKRTQWYSPDIPFLGSLSALLYFLHPFRSFVESFPQSHCFSSGRFSTTNVNDDDNDDYDLGVVVSAHERLFRGIPSLLAVSFKAATNSIVEDGSRSAGTEDRQQSMQKHESCVSLSFLQSLWTTLYHNILSRNSNDQRTANTDANLNDLFALVMKDVSDCFQCSLFDVYSSSSTPWEEQETNPTTENDDNMNINEEEDIIGFLYRPLPCRLGHTEINPFECVVAYESDEERQPFLMVQFGIHVQIAPEESSNWVPIASSSLSSFDHQNLSPPRLQSSLPPLCDFDLEDILTNKFANQSFYLYTAPPLLAVRVQRLGERRKRGRETESQSQALYATCSQMHVESPLSIAVPVYHEKKRTFITERYHLRCLWGYTEKTDEPYAVCSNQPGKWAHLYLNGTVEFYSIPLLLLSQNAHVVVYVREDYVSNQDEKQHDFIERRGGDHSDDDTSNTTTAYSIEEVQEQRPENNNYNNSNDNSSNSNMYSSVNSGSELLSGSEISSDRIGWGSTPSEGEAIEPNIMQPSAGYEEQVNFPSWVQHPLQFPEYDDDDDDDLSMGDVGDPSTDGDHETLI
jgi:hypothetical protein